MKRSQINRIIEDSIAFLAKHGFHLPPFAYFSPADWSMYQGSYQHTRNNYSYPSVRKTIFNETTSGTYQERIEKYLLQIGVSQKDIDDFRSIMLQ